jgi:Ca-activated chloride channel family protein
MRNSVAKNWGVFIVGVMLFWYLPNGFSQKKMAEQEPQKTRLLFVFDASQSMFGLWNNQQKIFVARNILSNWVDSLENIADLEIALRVYGDIYSVPPQICEDSRLVVPFGTNNIKKVKKALREIVPKGTTPITYALEQAAGDFPKCDNCRNIIVLITDGIEECGGDPCEVSVKLQQQGIILKPFVIGIGADFENSFDCVGTYIQAKNEEHFIGALHIMISKAMNSTTSQINLLDANHRPTTTNVPISIYDHETNLLKLNFIHTLNAFGVPDTLFLDPRTVYDIVVHTIPPVRSDSVVLRMGEHNTIAIDAPVGALQLGIISKEPISGLQALVKDPQTRQTYNLQLFGQEEQYITGSYTLEVLSLPRLIIPQVNINQNHATKVEIPGPGILIVKKPGLGYGSLFEEKDGQMIWVYNFRNEINHLESLYLLPGKYHIVYRTKFSNETTNSLNKRFVIKTGETVTIDLNK